MEDEEHIVTFDLNLPHDEIFDEIPEDQPTLLVHNDGKNGPDQVSEAENVLDSQETIMFETANDNDDGDDFTQKSNERFYEVSDAQLDYIASQTLAVTTKLQTKWGIRIFTGKYWPAYLETAQKKHVKI